MNENNAQKSIEEYSADELLKIMVDRHEWEGDIREPAERHNFVELVGEYIAKRSTGIVGSVDWASVQQAVSDAIKLENSFGSPVSQLQNDPVLGKLAEGVINAVYELAAIEIGALIGVDGKTLAKAVKVLADAARRGEDLGIVIDNSATANAIKNIANSAMSSN